jgi:hypothetical protein
MTDGDRGKFQLEPKILIAIEYDVQTTTLLPAARSTLTAFR